MPSRQEKKNAKRRAKYLKTRIRFSQSGTTKQSLKRNGSLNVKTIGQSLKRNGPLDAQGVEQILKWNGPLDVQDIEQILKRNGLRYCHSPERARASARSAKRVKVTQRYDVPLQPSSHIKMDYLTCYDS